MFTGFIRQLQVCKPLLVSILSLAGIFLLPAITKGQSTDCQRRTVPASVIDRDGFPIGGLTPARFAGTLDEAPITIRDAKVDAQPRRVVVLLDVSGSMRNKAGDKWKVALQVAGDIVSFLPAEHSVALLTFSDRVQDELGFPHSRMEIVERLKEMGTRKPPADKSKEHTALFGAVQKALGILRPTRPGDVIYIISDSEENASRKGRGDVEQALLAARVRVFASLLTLCNPEWRTSDNLPPRTPIAETLARATGGTVLHRCGLGPLGQETYVASSEEQRKLGAALMGLYRQMAEFYQLELGLPEPVNKPHEWKLELVPGEGFSPEGFQLIYPQKLPPCVAAAAK